LVAYKINSEISRMSVALYNNIMSTPNSQF
jgi:hypothetical protein